MRSDMSDTIKLIYTYTIATILIIGGLFILYQARLDPPDQVSDLKLIVSGFVGAAITFVFTKDTQTATARQVERNYASSAANQPTATVSGGEPPLSATVAPTVPPDTTTPAPEPGDG